MNYMAIMGPLEVYNYINYDLADSRTNDWWLITTPMPILIILGSYLYFVNVCGPRWMKDSKPYVLKTFLTYYNIFQIITNMWLIYLLITAGWLTHLTVYCEPIDYSLDPMAVRQAEATWWTMMLKLIDLAETGVFVLRKKDRQISFLHVYHHVTTLTLTWISVKYFAGGMCTFPIIVNSSVHIVMYTYYLLSSKGPTVQRLSSYIKPYITIIQIIQFFILLIHASQAFSPSCDVPSKVAVVYILNLLINLYLFTDFYRKTYTPSKKTA